MVEKEDYVNSLEKRLRDLEERERKDNRAMYTELARISGQIEVLIKVLESTNANAVQTATIEASTKSAHKRIDGVYKVAGMISTAVSLLIGVLAFILKLTIS